MKAFLRKTNPEKCRCGADRDAIVKGSVYDDGRMKKVLKEIEPCATCGDPAQTEELTKNEIEKAEQTNDTNMEKFTPKEMYYIKEKKSVGDDLFDWCLVKWKGKWELEDIKAFTGRMMGSLNIPADEDGNHADYGAVFSGETKQLFIREDKLDLFEGILADYADCMQPFDRVSDAKVRALEEAFAVKKPA